MTITDKQQRFVDEYLKDLNATAAYMRAGYRATGHAAVACAHKLMKNRYILQAIAEGKKAREARTDIEADRVVKETARIALFDPRKLFHDDGTPKGIHELDDDTAAAISGLKVVTKGNADMGFGEVLEYKIADKNSALEKLFRHLGLYEKDNEQQNPIAALIASMGKSAIPVVQTPADDDGDDE